MTHIHMQQEGGESFMPSSLRLLVVFHVVVSASMTEAFSTSSSGGKALAVATWVSV